MGNGPKSRAAPVETHTMNVQFLREHDGKPERVLKAQLIECFRRAYLAQTSSGDQLSVTLCLKTKHGPDESLVREIGAIFAGIFVVQEHLDILFLDENHERELRTVCSPFFSTSIRNQ